MTHEFLKEEEEDANSSKPQSLTHSHDDNTYIQSFQIFVTHKSQSLNKNTYFKILPQLKSWNEKW